MTIKYAWDSVKKKWGAVLEEVEVDCFSGYRIAVDADGISFPLRMRARKTVANKTNFAIDDIDEDLVEYHWIEYVVAEMIKFTSHGIIPIMCFDGKAHELKDKVKKERNQKTVDKKELIESLKEDIRSGDKFKVDKKKLTQLRTAESQLAYLSSKSKENLMNILRSMGFPCIQGSDGVEAEKLAAMLNIDGVAAAVYGVDFDLIAHGSVTMIRGYAPTRYDDEGKPIHMFEIIRRNNLLKEMGLKMTQLKDICVISGCDYNDHQNMKGVGFIGAVKLIKEHGSYNKIPKSFFREKEGRKKEAQNVNYSECIEMFKYRPSQECFDMKHELKARGLSEDANLIDLFNIDIDCEMLESILEENNIKKHYRNIINISVLEGKFCDIDPVAEFRKGRKKTKNKKIKVTKTKSVDTKETRKAEKEFDKFNPTGVKIFKEFHTKIEIVESSSSSESSS